MPFWETDIEPVVSSFGGVISLELRSQPSGVHANQRVDSRVVVVAATKDLGGNRVFFDLAFQTFQ